jgi:hypothetical protein
MDVERIVRQPEMIVGATKSSNIALNRYIQVFLRRRSFMNKFGEIVLSTFTWANVRRRIMAMMDDVESLKLNLLIMLQVIQMGGDQSTARRVEVSCANSMALLEHWVATQDSRVDA